MKKIFTICLLLIGAMTLQAQELKPFEADNGKWGFKDQNSKVIVAPKYDLANTFSDGMARVRLNAKFGFIDPTGKEIIPLKYERAYDFSEGLAVVNLNGKFGNMKESQMKMTFSKSETTEKIQQG
ncbi:MAG: WG repeat-containing protein [Bacteroidetes bacterium]|jgi:hypothetical protein|nr:WG repeat-containing protein [Bacteroidota bacterium]